jgi:hypothetical protein
MSATSEKNAGTVEVDRKWSMCLGASKRLLSGAMFHPCFSLSNDLVSFVNAVFFRVSIFGRKNMGLNLTALPNSALKSCTDLIERSGL